MDIDVMPQKICKQVYSPTFFNGTLCLCSVNVFGVEFTYSFEKSCHH